MTPVGRFLTVVVFGLASANTAVGVVAKWPWFTVVMLWVLLVWQTFITVSESWESAEQEGRSLTSILRRAASRPPGPEFASFSACDDASERESK